MCREVCVHVWLLCLCRSDSFPVHILIQYYDSFVIINIKQYPQYFMVDYYCGFKFPWKQFEIAIDTLENIFRNIRGMCKAAVY